LKTGSGQTEGEEVEGGSYSARVPETRASCGRDRIETGKTNFGKVTANIPEPAEVRM